MPDRFSVSAHTPWHRRAAARLSLDHPGYIEGVVVSGARNIASSTLILAFALALGCGHVMTGYVASLPFLGRLLYFIAPPLMARHGSWKVARVGGLLERIGFVAAAAVAVCLRPALALPVALALLTLGTIGRSIYDAAMTALHSEVANPGAFGHYTATKQRWAAISGLVFGSLTAAAVAGAEGHGYAAIDVRSYSLVAGTLLHLLLVPAFSRLRGRAAHAAPERPSMSITAEYEAISAPSSTSLWTRTVGFLKTIKPRCAHERAVVTLALAWGGSYGLSMQQGDVAAMTLFGWSPGRIGFLNAVLVGAGLIGVATWGKFGDRFGGRVLMQGTLLAMALDPVWTLLALLVHPWFYVVGYPIWGIATTGWLVAQNIAFVRTTGPVADRIRLMTLYNVAFGAAAGVTPMLGGVLLGRLDGPFSTRDAFVGLFLVTLVTRLLVLIVLRKVPFDVPHRRGHASAVYLRAVRRQAYRNRAIAREAVARTTTYIRLPRLMATREDLTQV